MKKMCDKRGKRKYILLRISNHSEKNLCFIQSYLTISVLCDVRICGEKGKEFIFLGKRNVKNMLDELFKPCQCSQMLVQILRFVAVCTCSP